MDPTPNISTSKQDFPPQGYTLLQSADGSAFAVPQYLVPVTHSAFDGFRGKILLQSKDLPEV